MMYGITMKLFCFRSTEQKNSSLLLRVESRKAVLVLSTWTKCKVVFSSACQTSRPVRLLSRRYYETRR